MQAYNKAIVALIAPLIIGVIQMFGISTEMTIEEFVWWGVGIGVTAFGVYFIPNRTKKN